jgi:outer membrane autotransporter protein
VSAPQERVLAAWSQLVGAWGQADGDGNAAGLKRTLGGILTGVDATFAETWRFGLAGGYTRSWFDVADRASKGASDNYHLALYGGGQLSGFGLRAGAALTWHDLEIIRTGFAGTLQANYSAQSGQVFGEVGHAFLLGTTAIEPYAALAHVALQTNRFDEGGGVAALTGQNSFGVTFATLGLRAASVLMLQNMPLTVRGGLGWRHAFGTVAPEATLAFSSGSPFTIAGAPLARDSLIAEGGVDFDLTPSTKLGLAYAGALSHSAQDHAIKGSFLHRF